MRAYLGIGSNVGDMAAMLDRAVAGLAADPGITLVARSSDYRTPPWGKTDQPWFLNGAVAVETSLDPHGLLDACLRVEHDLGRVREEAGARKGTVAPASPFACSERPGDGGDTVLRAVLIWLR